MCRILRHIFFCLIRLPLDFEAIFRYSFFRCAKKRGRTQSLAKIVLPLTIDASVP